MKNNKSRKGTITLETAIVLPIFFFMFMFLFGFFRMLNAKNQISHALLQTTRSLAMDSYIVENTNSIFKDDGESMANNFWGGIGDLAVDLIRLSANEYYSSKNVWYHDNSHVDTVRKRFLGFMMDATNESSIDETSLDAKLKGMGIPDGLNGITFSYTVVDGELTVKISYELQHWFDFFGIGSIPVEQSVSANMWAFSGGEEETEETT